MTFSWNAALLDQLTFDWEVQFLPRIENLTDEEYLWEPVAGCWSVRPDEGGAWRQDLAEREPWPPPFMTIAWRLAHIASFPGTRTSNQFGDGQFHRNQLPWSGAAGDAIRIVTAACTNWCDGVRALGEEGLFRPCGPSEHRFQDAPVLTLIHHINHEFLHHAAEVALMRDLYRDMVAKGAGGSWRRG